MVGSGWARGPRRAVLALPLAVALSVVAAPPAHASVAVTRAEISGSTLRVEGTATASRDITVDGVVMGRSDSGGRFRIERSGYAPPADCTIDVNDGSAAVSSARLSGCTETQEPPPPAGDTTPPTAPALSATVVGTTANLSWTTSTDDVGVTGYRVSRNGTALPGTVSGTSFADTGLAPGTYTYAVTAVDAAGNVSAASNDVVVQVATEPPPATDSTAPSVPTSVGTTVVGNSVNIVWDPSSDDTAVAGYRVTRNGTVLGTTTDTTYFDSSLPAGTYSYTVAAFDGAGNVSAESAAAMATVQPSEELSFLTPSAMPDATVGQPYLGYIVSSDPPGPSTFKFKLVSGKVPDGTRFIENTLPHRPESRVIGTPESVGSFSFTVEVTDGTGAMARRTFTIRVLAAP